MRVVLVGNSGSGKSTCARALADRHGLAHLDMDAIVWEPGRIAVPRDPAQVEADLRAFLDAHAAWVVEGCYGELAAIAAQGCDALVFLDPGLDACLANNRRRDWEPHKYASREAQDAMLDALQAWVADYYGRDDAWSWRAHRALFDAQPGAKHHVTAPIGVDQLAVEVAALATPQDPISTDAAATPASPDAG